MKKNIAIIMIISIFAKFSGFFRDLVLTYFYGASNISDAYLISQTIPTTIFSFVGAGLITSFIPIYNKVRKEQGENESDKFTSNLMNILFLISAVIILFIFLFTTPLVKVFASGFSGETLTLAVNYTRISAFGVFFTGTIYILSSYLQIKNNFLIPAMIAIPSNIVVIISIFIAAKINNNILAIGILVSIATQLLFLLPSVIKLHFKFNLYINFKDKYLKEFLILAIPVIIGVSVNQLNIVVDKNIASRIVEGGISSINYADKLISIIQGIFVVPVVTVIYPTLSHMAAEKNYNGLIKTINQSLVSVSLLIIPGTLGAMVFARPIVELLFLRGNFDESAATMTAGALFYYAIGLLAYAFRDILSKIFYSFNDTKTPMINTTIGVILNIILNIVLGKLMGIAGLALATSISATVTMILLIYNLKDQVRIFKISELLPKLHKVLAASIIMCLVSFGLFTISKGYLGQNTSLIISIIVASIIYGITIYFMKIEEVILLIKTVKMKNSNKNK